MVLLAKSYKPGGKCIAGKRVEYIEEKKVKVCEWIRPVFDDGTGHGALPTATFTYQDGKEAKVLDIVEVTVKRKANVAGQPENYIIDDTVAWKKISHLNATSIPNLKENATDIWNEAGVESNIVTSDFDENGFITQSLYLIKPSNFEVTLTNEYNEFEEKYKRKIVAKFDYSNTTYENISITCPAVRRILANQYPNEGETPKTLALNKGDDYILCMSLSPRFGGADHHYKLVATAFDFDGYLQRNYSA